MQFGRIHGIALIVLGLLLIGLQLNFAFAGRTEVNAPLGGEPTTKAMQQPRPHRLGPLAGIVGGVSLLGGLAIFATARRRDEPEPQHQVK